MISYQLQKLFSNCRREELRQFESTIPASAWTD